MDEQLISRSKHVQQRLSDTEESVQGSSDETANNGEDESSGPGNSSGHSDGSSNEMNSSHASQSAGSPSREVRPEDTAHMKPFKEDDEDDDRGHNPPKSSCGTDLQNRKLESQAGICLGDSQGPSERSGTSNGTGKDLVFNTK